MMLRTVENSRNQTGVLLSPKARMILENWDDALEHFIQVTPIEYRKVLEEQKIQAINEKIKKVQYD